MVKVLPRYLVLLIALVSYVYATEVYPNAELLEFLADWGGDDGEIMAIDDFIEAQELQNDKEVKADNEEI